MQLTWQTHVLDGEPHYSADTPFGSYRVERRDYRGWVWAYCFDEYYDEDELDCEGPDEGKNLANDHWQDRIAPIIAPYKKEGEADV